MNKALLVVLATIIITLTIALLSSLVPVPRGNNPFDFYFNLMVSVGVPLLSIGAAIVIVMGFGAFTKQFRRAYTIMFSGLIIWGVSYLQLPLIVLLDQLNNNLFISATVVPFIGSVMLIFVGTKTLTKLFNVKTIATRWWFVFLVIIAVSTVIAFLPHAPSDSDELGFDMANVLIIAASTFFAICAYHILLIKRQAGVAFTNAFAWLCLSMFVTAFIGGYGTTFSSMLFGPGASLLTNILAIVPSCIGAALFLRSAYSFNQIVESEDVQGQFVARDFFGHPVHPKKNERVNSVDIVTYTAALVSTPAALDRLLDTVRNITALHEPNSPLSSTDEDALKQVYLKIEQYLLTQEAIRKFTKEGLRQVIAQKLLLTPESPQTFWNKLT